MRKKRPRRTTRKQAAELLARMTRELRKSVEGQHRSLALCAKWSRLFDAQAAELAEARAENACLRVALNEPERLLWLLSFGHTQVSARIQ